MQSTLLLQTQHRTSSPTTTTTSNRRTMKLFVLFFLASALIAAPTLAADNSHEHITLPLAQMLMHDSLVTGVRTMRHPGHIHGLHHGHPHKPHPDFEGTVTGNYVQAGGKGSYTGTFKGVSKPYKTAGDFKFDMEGSASYMGLDATYASGVRGDFHVRPKTGKVSVNAYYGSKLRGSIHGKKMTGKCSGRMTLKFSQTSIFYEESGHFDVYVSGKPVSGKYYASVVGNSASISVYGTYAGKPFHVKHSASLNVVLALGMDMNPMAVQRNYGTVTGTAGGKKFTQKYDQKGTQMFPAIQ